MLPTPFVVQKVKRETSDTYTLDLTRAEGATNFAFAPGQFNMLYAFGAGEVPISISGDPARPETLVHTVQGRGERHPGHLPLEAGRGSGSAGSLRGPLAGGPGGGRGRPDYRRRPGVGALAAGVVSPAAHRGEFGNIEVIYGARTPKDLLYPKELEVWRGRFDLRVHVTVDPAEADWHSNVGVVTKIIDRARFDPPSTVALVCGPGVMMRFTVLELMNHGLDAFADLRVHGAQHEMRHRPVRPLPVGAVFCLQGRPGVPL